MLTAEMGEYSSFEYEQIQMLAEHSRQLRKVHDSPDNMDQNTGHET